MTGRNIAVIGSGVSGITACYVLSHTDYVTIFEADGRLGGHADTHLVTPPSGPPLGVDTGFIVYNERTYPLLTRLFAEFGVATQPAEMSMSVRCAGCGLQYAGRRGLGGLTHGLLRGPERARYLHMLAEIPRFHRAARRELARPDHARPPTLGEFLRARRFGAYFERAAKRLRIVQREDYGPHYAQTLRIWRERFGAHADEVARLGFDEVFRRMWNFYLSYSEAGFLAGYIDVSQLTLARI